MKLLTGFANVTSFKLKITTLILTSTIPLNLFMEIIFSFLSHMKHLLSFILFIHLFHTESSFIETSLLRSYVFFIYGGLQRTSIGLPPSSFDLSQPILSPY